MDIHDIRAKLAKDEPTIGTWLQLPSADVAELMARAGYDWVAVDMEHGSFGRTGLPDIFRAIQCGGIPCRVRSRQCPVQYSGQQCPHCRGTL